MKKLIFLIALITIYQLLFTFSIYAASPTPNPDPVKEKVEEQIDELKERIASRVAQLNLVEKRGIIGTVTDITGTQITLSDIRTNTRFVDVDELTKFSGDSDSFGFSDIKRGAILSVLGLYNKQSRRILARSVEEVSLPKIVNGFVATVDSENFIINVATSDNEQFEVEIETTTKTFSYDEEGKELVRSGFSKITEGMSIFIIGEADEKNEKNLIADRIIIFPNVIKTPSFNITPSITPSTGSGKKLTPIVK